jgi:hypothetical protein
MTFYINQTDFSHGEIAPTLRARHDLTVYRKAADKLRNVVVIPQGGARRRFGTHFISNLTDLHSVVTDKFMLIPFEYGEDENYLLVMTEGNMDIYFEDQFLTTVITPYTQEEVGKLELKYASFHQTLVIVHENHAPMELLKLTVSPFWSFSKINFKQLPTYDFLSNYDEWDFSLDDVTIGKPRTLTVTTANFLDDRYVGGLFIGLGISPGISPGIARITAKVDATHLTVTILSEFDPVFATAPGLKGKNVQLTEPVWGNVDGNHGYPRTVTFFENRMFFGGTKDLPSSVFGSVSNDSYNFDTGQGLADEAIIATIGNKNSSTIRNIESSSSLQIFTRNSEFSSFGENYGVLKPGATSLKRQSSYGSENIIPHSLSNQTFFIKRGGTGVMSFVFDNTTQTYQSLEVSLLAPHLIDTPIDSAVFEGSKIEDANYLMLVNSDGSLVVYQTLIDEKVSAWTLSSTEGKFKRIIALGGEIYFGVERIVDGFAKQYLEKMDWSIYVDSAFIKTYATPEKTITGLEHLEGKEVIPTGDGYILNPKTVINGEIELEVNVNEIVVGLNYYPLIQPLPIGIAFQNGSLAYQKKKIGTVYIDYYNSLGIYINGELIPYKEFGQVLDYPAPVGENGIYEFTRFGTWVSSQTVQITQIEPLPMTVLGIGYKMVI